MKGLPTATYRLQLTADFPFDAALATLPQLKTLGISHVYASPFLKARQGSTHGYDIIDHTQINPELGGEDAFERFSQALKDNSLGLILDFVPNHMGVHYADNAWWLDVLEWGPKSRFADAFDIEWDILPYRKRAGILLPILGTPYGEALGNGDIKIAFDQATGSFSAWYFEHRLPINPVHYPEILRAIATTASPADRELLMAVAGEYTSARLADWTQAENLKARLRQKQNVTAVETSGMMSYQAGASNPAQTAALHQLLERQHYRLSDWHLAASDINYRRFFDINTLAGLAVENRATFDRVHSLIGRLIRTDKIQGLRIDHIDGLRDPAQYFRRLQKLIADATSATKRPFYLVVEKILGEHEALPQFAGVHGTTGYECLNEITHVLSDTAGLDALGNTWRLATNTVWPFSTIVLESKRRVIETLLASEFTVLVRLLSRIAAGHYSTRDFSEHSLRQALELYVIHFPVYRTYVTAAGADAQERGIIEQTLDRARQDWFDTDSGIFEFLRDVLTLDLINQPDSRHSRTRVRRLTFKLQQFTGPLMAKGLEDTAFYRYHHLIALNEVGGHPASRGLTVDAFHDKMIERSRQWPFGLTATATHDTKRGEDARARLIAISELPGEWAHAVGSWKTMNAGLIETDGDRRSPSVADEYMIYQSLAGVMPLEGVNADLVGRLQRFAQKSVREAKLHSSWLNPNDWYETGMANFVAKILDPSVASDFLASISKIIERLALLGALNSLSQLTLKAMIPGVPDFYQGTEFWDFSLVDPDNRRPVDMAMRKQAIDQLSSSPNWQQLARHWQDGRLKLRWTQHLLHLRRTYPEIFCGTYVPLKVEGTHANRVVAFARQADRKAVAVFAMRQMAEFTNGGRHWPDFRSLDARVKLPDVLQAITGASNDGHLDIASVMTDLPVHVRVIP